MTGITHYIYWSNYTANTYLYGSSIDYIAPDNVVFENELMPSGTRIQTWKSKTHYQADRQALQLPILLASKTYKLQANINTTPSNTLYVRLNFFDRFDECLSFVMLKDLSTSLEFVCPLGTQYYTVELMSAGCVRLEFHYLTISEVSQNKDRLLNIDKNEPYLMVLFTEPRINGLHHIQSHDLKGIKNVLCIENDKNQGHFYLDDKVIKEVSFLIDCAKMDLNSQLIYFAGYGPVSNLAALYYATSIFLDSQAFVTRDFYTVDDYMKKYREYGIQKVLEKDWIDTHLQKRNVTLYGKGSMVSDVFVQPFVDYKSQLAYLHF
ncbi:accessory Sec system protein Asp3 [Granulicatella sp. zg-ZJ]|uniref:accessory Sec system protein Asp3 n=1 Tax=Granulicatella sp. zg-ZJ TaxID=2678504 RepID=UPI0013D3303C|nr:accessory Sec system protein Asp3 [Granulicatella sp. zg-ZJ]NEW63222.1 accessory Sec system protein Asp3 [Granulicatella sp. zg-ZJ]